MSWSKANKMEKANKNFIMDIRYLRSKGQSTFLRFTGTPWYIIDRFSPNGLISWGKMIIKEVQSCGSFSK